VPKKRTIDNDHEYIDNTFNKGRNAAIAEMLAGIGGKDNAYEQYGQFVPGCYGRDIAHRMEWAVLTTVNGQRRNE
jgi:hypothetical protein